MKHAYLLVFIFLSKLLSAQANEDSYMEACREMRVLSVEFLGILSDERTSREGCMSCEFDVNSPLFNYCNTLIAKVKTFGAGSDYKKILDEYKVDCLDGLYQKFNAKKHEPGRYAQQAKHLEQEIENVEVNYLTKSGLPTSGIAKYPNHLDLAKLLDPTEFKMIRDLSEYAQKYPSAVNIADSLAWLKAASLDGMEEYIAEFNGKDNKPQGKWLAIANEKIEKAKSGNNSTALVLNSSALLICLLALGHKVFRKKVLV